MFMLPSYVSFLLYDRIHVSSNRYGIRRSTALKPKSYTNCRNIKDETYRWSLHTAVQTGFAYRCKISMTESMYISINIIGIYGNIKLPKSTLIKLTEGMDSIFLWIHKLVFDIVHGMLLHPPHKYSTWAVYLFLPRFFFFSHFSTLDPLKPNLSNLHQNTCGKKKLMVGGRGRGGRSLMSWKWKAVSQI